LDKIPILQQIGSWSCYVRIFCFLFHMHLSYLSNFCIFLI